MEALANAIMRDVNVYIVTSNIDAKGYSSYVNLDYIYNYIFGLIQKAGVTTTVAREKLGSYLHLANISYTNDANDGIRSHNKIWIVDNKIFYIGSHNIYPSSLQQFGIIFDSKDEATYLNKSLFYPMWKNAQYYVPNEIKIAPVINDK